MPLKSFNIILAVILGYLMTQQGYAQQILHPSNSEILLFKYIGENNITKVDSLLNAGVSAEAIYFKQLSALAYAAAKGHSSILNRLISAQANLEKIPDYGLTKATPLGYSMIFNQNECATALINAGASIQGKAPQGQGFSFANIPQTYNWLMHAIKTDNEEGVLLLLEAGADPNYIADLYMDYRYNGKTPLILAAEEGKFNLVKLLLDNNANINGMGKDYQGQGSGSGLMAAAAFGHESVVDLLLQNGADINLRDTGGMTALLSSGTQSQIGTANKLLDNGANINDVNQLGHNALMVSMTAHRFRSLASISNRINAGGVELQFAALLNSAKGDWVLKDTTGTLTKTDIKFIEREIKSIVVWDQPPSENLNRQEVFTKYKFENLGYTNMLISHNINLSHRWNNKTAAKMAQENRLDETLGALLNAGIPTDGLPPSSLLQFAIKTNNDASFRQYYHGANAVSDSLKCSLLGSAVLQENLAIVDFLFSKGADVNCINGRGQSLLHLAAYNGAIAVVNKLVQQGANRFIKDGHNSLPVDIAFYVENKEVIDALNVPGAGRATPLELGYSIADAEDSYFSIHNPFLSGIIHFYQAGTYSNALDKEIVIKDPIIALLNQDSNDSIKWKYATALFSQGFLEPGVSSGGLATFKRNQDYNAYPSFSFKVNGNYKTGTSSRQSFSTTGTLKTNKREDKESTHDITTSAGIHILDFGTIWGQSKTAVQMGVGVSSYGCGGWNRDCLVVISGKCYSFSDADPRTGDMKYSISGSYKIPAVEKWQGINVAYPNVEVWNYDKTVPLQVKQAGNTYIIDPNEKRNFGRQLGEIEIISSWNKNVSGSGNNCVEDTKESAFQVKFPYTWDVRLTYNGTELEDRLKNYTEIYLLKKTLQEGADTLSANDLYGLKSTIALKTQLAENAYKNIVKAKLVGVVNFLENTDFKNFNDALILLAQEEQLTLQDVRFQLRQLANINNPNPVLVTRVRKIENSLSGNSLQQIRNLLLEYKSDYFDLLHKKITSYNLLLLEYAMYIPNDMLQQQLALDRIPIRKDHMNAFAKAKFNF